MDGWPRSFKNTFKTGGLLREAIGWLFDKIVHQFDNHRRY